MKIKTRHGVTFALVICAQLISFLPSQGQVVVTSRFNNPTYTCSTDKYCVDVEFKANASNYQVFGVNVRFFYDDSQLEYSELTSFQNGYAIQGTPAINTSGCQGPCFFNFTGQAEYFNGAVQRINPNAPPVYINDWVSLFKICFIVDNPGPEPENFCPPLVFDLEVNPANGSFFAGDGWLVTLIPPGGGNSQPSTENVDQYNWDYNGGSTPPYGAPIEEICIPVTCDPVLTCPSNVTIPCHASTLPPNTGSPTFADFCNGDPVFSYSDQINTGTCPQAYSIIRTWTVTNACEETATCTQSIQVVDNTPPTITCPASITVDGLTPPPFMSPVVQDNCDMNVNLTFTQTTTSSDCSSESVITRTWTATDDCGNSATCSASITLNDIIVTNTNDAGPGSLRNAIGCASPGDTILFATSLSGQVINITSTRLVLSENIVLYYQGTTSPVIQSSIPGLFDVTAGATVQCRNLTIVSGIAGYAGAAFYNAGHLILTDMDIFRNPSLPAGNSLIRNNTGSQLELRGINQMEWE